MKVTVTLNSLNEILAKRGLEIGGKVQRFLGTEVARRSDKFVPLRAGPLKNTAQVLKDGAEVRYIQPYARRQYYSPRRAGSATGPLRGPKWFERMKAAEGKDLIAVAAKLAGGKAR